ncbi:MAG TPA: substrate-binding domain-containing protein [Flavipsychrobacter sp.]
MKFAKLVPVLGILLLTAVGCGEEKPKDTPTDTLTSGTIDISVDETYRHVVQEQLEVFDSSYPEAKINAQYKSESECIQDFMEGKVRMILVTRTLGGDEKAVLEEKKIVPTSLDIAKDAIAVIVNNNNQDTVFSVAQLKGILTGQYSKKYSVVFDNPGSSTLRYMLDSLIPGEKLGDNVYAAKGNDSVIQYVANNPDAIGFVSVSYVSDYEDPEGLAFIGDVTVAAIYNDSLEKAYKPYQAYIAPEWYPLTRKLYYVHRDTYSGLAAGFAKFLREQRGQLVFKQARLFPTRVNIIFREAGVSQ